MFSNLLFSAIPKVLRNYQSTASMRSSTLLLATSAVAKGTPAKTPVAPSTPSPGAKVAADSKSKVGKGKKPKVDNFIETFNKYSPKIVGDEKFVELYQSEYSFNRIKLDWFNESPNYHFWPKWRIRRDNNHRKIVKEHAPMRMRLKVLKDNPIMPTGIRKEAADALRAMPKAAHPSNLVNFCQITARGRGNVIRYRLSRFTFRDLADHGKLCGVIRAVW